MTIKFYNKALESILSMKVPEEKVLEQVEALITLGFDPVVEMEEKDSHSHTP